MASIIRKGMWRTQYHATGEHSHAHPSKDAKQLQDNRLELYIYLPQGMFAHSRYKISVREKLFCIATRCACFGGVKKRQLPFVDFSAFVTN